MVDQPVGRELLQVVKHAGPLGVFEQVGGQRVFEVLHRMQQLPGQFGFKGNFRGRPNITGQEVHPVAQPARFVGLDALLKMQALKQRCQEVAVDAQHPVQRAVGGLAAQLPQAAEDARLQGDHGLAETLRQAVAPAVAAQPDQFAPLAHGSGDFGQGVVPGDLDFANLHAEFSQRQ